jgi:CubicO group peptidase (beta-lactamase class C family)
MTNSIIDRLIEESVDARRLPSVSAAIGNRDGELYRKAYGYARCFPDAAPVLEYPPEEFTGKVPVTERTLYDMASLTKVMSTTMVAFRLMERGMLTLDDTLGRYLDAPEDKRDITVRQLMTHTSGMVASKHIDEIDPDPARACESVLSLPLRDKPGRSVEYSCMGYILLGKALERGETDIACTEYRPEYGKYLCGVVHDENARFQNGISANAGLFSCLDDCVTFARMLLRGGETEDGTRFLSPALLREATRCHTAGMGEARGIGFHINRFPDADVNRYAGPAGELFSPGSFGHTGYTGTNLFVDPVSGLYAVILTNRVHLTRSCDAHLRLRRTVGNAAAAMWGK